MEEPPMKNKILLTTLCLSITPNLWAQTEAKILANELELSGLDDKLSYQLQLQLPNKQLKQINLQPNNKIIFSASDFALDAFADGQYKYELTPMSSMNKSRSSNEHKSTSTASEKISGAFTVFKGQTNHDQDDSEYHAENDGTMLRAPVITGDQSIRNSLCVGTDCLDAESFGFDTIRLKENNMRIGFDDTSVGTFAANDWELTVNSSASGGLSFFGITDVTAGNQPFTVEAGAGNNALYVDDAGRIGVGTSVPAVELHVVDGDTPTQRLEQDGSSGWAAQTWDLAGNETNFFVRDVTNGSTLPFRVRPGAPTSAIDISADGNIGMGTSTPQNSLHIKESTGNAGIILENTTTAQAWKFVNKSNSFQVSKVGAPGTQFTIYDDGSALIGDTGSSTNFVMDSNGNVTIQGALTQNSDIKTKENIQLVNADDILNKVMDLPISIWNYKFDDESVKHLGPMAQDFFKQFNLGATDNKIATIDTSGVALASIKALGEKLKIKEQQISTLEAQNKLLNERLDQIESLLNK